MYIGSIKANIGHTEGCSGLAGVFKAILCLEHGMLTPTAGLDVVNPKLTLDKWRLAIPHKNMRWPNPGLRRASVNSFGFGGSNAHVILDDAYHYLKQRGLQGTHATSIEHQDSNGHAMNGVSSPLIQPKQVSGHAPSITLNSNGCQASHDLPRAAVSNGEASLGNTYSINGTAVFKDNSPNPKLFVFSAKDNGTLQKMAPGYATMLESPKPTSQHDAVLVSNLAFSLSNRRTWHDSRGYAISSTTESLIAQLAKGLPKVSHFTNRTNIVFVFTGQGAQWPSMGTQLLNRSVFRRSIDHAQDYLRDLGCTWDMIDELRKIHDSNVEEPEYSQTLCTAIQIAIVDLLRSWDIRPRAVVGHSSGEIGAYRPFESKTDGFKDPQLTLMQELPTPLAQSATKMPSR
jgi:acyl transferase domain-containing protein